MRAFSKKSSYLFIIMMIAALLLTGTVPSFAAKTKNTYTTPEGTVYPKLETSQPESLAGLKATSAILIDGGSGQVLYEKNAEAVKDPASITKIMTCLLTLENKDMDDEITIDFQPTTEGHNLALKQGEVLTVRDLLHALMLYSCNDAAEVLAVAVGGDIDSFADMMNERAKECGATSTTFANPNGLNPEGKPHNQTTAHDIALMAREAMKNPQFRKLVKTKTYTIQKTNMSEARKEMKSTNVCLGTYKGTTGIKTGTSTTAGFCFCGSAKRGNTELIAVALDSGDKLRFSDVETLCDYGFQNYHTYTAAEKGKELDQIRVRRGDLRSSAVGTTDDLDLTLAKKDKGEGITTEITLTDKKLTAPVKKGTEAGTVAVYDKNHKKLAEAKLVTLESVKKGGLLSYIGVADEDRGIFLGGLILMIVLVAAIILIMKRMQRKKRARRRAQRNRNMRRKAWEREKDPFKQ